MKGIDVSRHQGDIDWKLVKESGIGFAIIKAGGSDDGFYEDSKFQTNYEEAKNNGIPVGAYYFVGPNCTSEEAGKADAERFLNIINGKKFEMPVALDLESTDPSDRDGATDAAIAFCEVLENAGYYVVIYASDVSGFKDRLDVDRLTEYDKWVARYGSEPQYMDSCYGIWQYTSEGSVSGISGNVDMNISYENYPAIIKASGLNGFSINDDLPQNGEAPEVNNEEEPEPEVNNEEVSDENPNTYVVQSGDTLSGIADRFNTSVESLVELNNIEDPNLIYSGQELKLSSDSDNNNEIYYAVLPGDTLSGIADRYGTTYQEIAEMNGIDNPNLIYPGQYLRVK